MKLSRYLALSFAAAVLCLPFSGVQAKTVIEVAHTHKETHPDHLAVLAFKDYVEKHAGNDYEVQIYPDNKAGSNEQVIELLRSGAVQFMVISTSNLEPYNKKYALFSIPYLFSSEENYEKFITDLAVMEDLGAKNEEDGFTPLSAFTSGSRSFYAKSPINTPEDLKGKTFRVQTGRTNKEMMSFFDSNYVTISFGEVYSALEKGLIDGAENNELALVEQKHGEFCKYYSYDHHQMIPDLLVGSSVFLYSIPHKDFDIFKQAAIEAQKVEFSLWKEKIQQAKKKAQQMGVKFKEVNVDDFRNTVSAVHEHILKSRPEIKELYDKAIALDSGKAAKK